MRKRNNKKQIWLSDEELELMNKNAELTGMNVSDYLRQLITGYKPKEKPPEDFYNSIKEIRRIGKNINQLVKLASASKKINVLGLNKELKMLDNLVLDIKRKYLKPDK